MANYTVSTPTGFNLLSDKRRAATPGGVVPNSPLSATLTGADKDISSMRAQLTALNAGLYTSSVLDAMTANDMIFALRTGYDSAGMF